MNCKRLASTIAFGALTVALAGNANALTININAGAGLAGNAAALGAFNRAADQWSVEPATVEDVLEAQDWARSRAQGALKAHAGAAQEVITTR